MRFLIAIILIALWGCNNGPDVSKDNIKSISVITIERNSHTTDSTQILNREDINKLVGKINSGTKEPFLIFLPRYILYLNYGDSITNINVSSGNGIIIFEQKKGAYTVKGIDELIESMKSHYRQYPKKGRNW